MRQEHYHHSAAQVRSYLTEALKVIDDVDPPEELRQVSFLKACDWLAAKSIVEAQFAPGIANMAIPRV
jgi:hypothetical protein